jgi:AhpD family alkylhydroperoxidase
MPPKMLKTVLNVYLPTLAEGAFETLGPKEIEIIYTAVSAANNCEMCLSFHAMGLGKHPELDKKDIDEILLGGLPKDPKDRALVIATKYAMAHKGVLLEREKKHLNMLGITDDMYTELNFLAGVMAANNQNYVHLIANSGLELDDMLKAVSPFKDTVYKGKGEL